MATALGLRLYGLAKHELWLDEGFTFNVIAGPDWLTAVRASEPPLYPCLLHLWTAIAGTGEAALRAPSVLFGTAFVVAVMWAGRELFDRTVALWSGLVAATSPIQIYYSQEARAYALLTLVLLCTYVLIVRAIRTNGFARWALVAVAMAAGPYTHYLAPVALAPTVALVLLAGQPGRLRRYTLAVGAAVLLYLPWFVWSFVAAQHSFGGLDWIRPAWEQTPPRWAIPKSLEVLYLGAHKGFLPISLKQFGELEIPFPVRALGLAAMGLLGVWVAAPRGASGIAERRAGWRVGALWVLLFTPLVLLMAMSLARPIYIVGRYDQLAFPAFPILAGVGLAKLGSLPRWRFLLQTAGAVILLSPIAVVLARYYAAPPTTLANSRRSALALNVWVQSGDLVLLDQPRGYVVLYQLAQLGYAVQPGRCENSASSKRFACWHFPRPLGPMLTQEDLDRMARRIDVAKELATVYLPTLGAADRDVFVVLEAYGTGPGGTVVSDRDRLLLEALAADRFRPVRIDNELGIVQLHHAQ